MKHFLFKKDISNNILYDFLNHYCFIENNYYILDKLVYKKYEYNNTIILDFLNTLKCYYKPNKLFYIDRELSYNNLLTIIRQICKFKNIEYFNKIKYDHNKYYIIYYIKF